MMARGAYAIAIIVLRVSSMRRPSHMLRVVCGCPLESLKKEEYAGYARKEDKYGRHSALPMPQYQSSEVLWSRESVYVDPTRSSTNVSLRAGAASLARSRRAEMAVTLRRSGRGASTSRSRDAPANLTASPRHHYTHTTMDLDECGCL